MSVRKILLLACLASGPVAAENADGPPFIAVHGTARTEVVPDIFPLKLTLVETSKDLAATQATIESLARKLIDVAKGQGIASDDFSIGNLSIEPKTQYEDNSNKEIFLGNEYSREIKVRFHDLAKLKSFLALVIK